MRLGDNSGCERMLAGTLDACRKPEQFVLCHAFSRDDGDDRRLAFGQGAGFVDHQRVDALHPFEHFGVLDKHAGLGATPHAHHDGHRCGKPQRAGTGDDENGDGRNQRKSEARLRSEHHPRGECEQCNRDHKGHEPGCDLVGQTLDRRAAALRVRHHLHNARQHRIAPNLLGADNKRARTIDGATDHFCAYFLGDRHGFPGDQGFVDRRPAFHDFAINRDFLAGPNAHQVAGDDSFERDFLFAIIPDPPSRLWREVKQSADGAGGMLARAQLQNLTEQHQYGDDGRRLVVNGNGPVHCAEGRREKVRENRRDHAVEPSHAGTQCDQREHVEIVGDERLPAAHEERPSRPQNHGSCERKLDPDRNARCDKPVQIEQMPAHLEHDHRQREDEPDPESPRHIGEFRIWRRIARHDQWLQRHAADGARSRTILPDFGMHRTSVDSACRSVLFRWRFRVEIFLRIGDEFRPAAGRAEMISLAPVLGVVRRLCRIDRHPAHMVFR